MYRYRPVPESRWSCSSDPGRALRHRVGGGRTRVATVATATFGAVLPTLSVYETGDGLVVTLMLLGEATVIPIGTIFGNAGDPLVEENRTAPE